MKCITARILGNRFRQHPVFIYNYLNVCSVDQWLGVQLEKWLLRYSLVNENSDSSFFPESSSYSFWFLRCAPKYWKAKLYSQTLAIALSWFNLLKISLGEDFAPVILMALEVCQNSNAMPEETLRHF